MDARIYYRGALAFMRSEDPWKTYVLDGDHPFHFAGLPSTVQLLAPFTVLPEGVFVALAIALSALAALVVVRSLRLPIWWLAFPPVVEGVSSGNPQILVLALLLAGGSVGTAVAAGLKVYAVIPPFIQGRWKPVATTGLLLLVSVLVSPGLWGQYLAESGTISRILLDEAFGGFSAVRMPLLLLPPTIVAVAYLLLRDRTLLAWLVVPALWPATQLHYSTFALPVITPWAAFLLAIPVRGFVPIAVIGYALAVALRQLGRRLPYGFLGLESAGNPLPLQRLAEAGAILRPDDRP